MLLFQFLLTFHETHNGMPHFITCDYSCADWDSFHDHLRDIPWLDIFKSSASAAGSQFCEWVQVGIDVYISHCKYQVS